MALEYTLRPFTIDEYHRMAEIGVLRDDERVELIDGAIVEMSPIGQRHWNRHMRIVEYLIGAMGDRAMVAGQSSLELGIRDEPQPDIAILARRSYEKPHPVPAPAEIYAVIELADSSLRKDLGPKLRLYARHGIVDYLVVDLEANVLLHHHDPHDLGYDTCDPLNADGTFTIAALPDIALSARAFLAAGS